MKPRLLISLVVAIAAFVSPFIGHFGIAISASFALAGIWVVLFIGGFFRFKKHAFWLLFGLPFALYWPVAWFLAIQECARNIQACP